MGQEGPPNPQPLQMIPIGANGQQFDILMEYDGFTRELLNNIAIFETNHANTQPKKRSFELLLDHAVTLEVQLNNRGIIFNLEMVQERGGQFAEHGEPTGDDKDTYEYENNPRWNDSNKPGRNCTCNKLTQVHMPPSSLPLLRNVHCL
ncbi:hypothetical protein LIER_24216 [Lithospermum erythrorhizon]|uniref:Uncharacterized protein n=1 Tax=Lithospermum erythrorhizon TaxID=34254 RepID=A0AAV3R413_LITER